MVSDNVVIMTREEFEKAADIAFRRGVQRGRFEERADTATQLSQAHDTLTAQSGL